MQIWVALLMLLNMGIAMTAEYTAVGDLFELVVGTERVPIVVIIGVVSMIYTAYGGLYISIITDQWQVSTSCTLHVIMLEEQVHAIARCHHHHAPSPEASKEHIENLTHMLHMCVCVP